jgi:hypothetical protein
MAAAPLIGTIASTGMNLMGGMQSASASAGASRYQAQVARNNAIIARQNASYAAQVGGTQAQAQDFKNRAQLGDIYSVQSASGIDTEMGSPVAVRESAASLGRLDTETIYANAMNKVRDYEAQSTNYEAQAGLAESAAKNAQSAGTIGAFGSLITGASSFADKWQRYQNVGVSGFGSPF